MLANFLRNCKLISTVRLCYGLEHTLSCSKIASRYVMDTILIGFMEPDEWQAIHRSLNIINFFTHSEEQFTSLYMIKLYH